mmetsp:Transcript_4531/g.11395  ORF Transcript_4531/g.11395 Transcript_4531/m.11395 type:complete len:229 (+) Transcript_4531:398-1084(+)
MASISVASPWRVSLSIELMLAAVAFATSKALSAQALHPSLTSCVCAAASLPMLSSSTLHPTSCASRAAPSMSSTQAGDRGRAPFLTLRMAVRGLMAALTASFCHTTPSTSPRSCAASPARERRSATSCRKFLDMRSAVASSPSWVDPLPVCTTTPGHSIAAPPLKTPWMSDALVSWYLNASCRTGMCPTPLSREMQTPPCDLLSSFAASSAARRMLRCLTATMTTFTL